MALSEYHTDLIAKYMTHALTDQEREAFDTALESAAFRKELLMQAQIIDALDSAVHADLKAKLKSYDVEDEHGPNSKHFFLEPYIKYAAVFVFLVGAFLLFQQFGGEEKHDYSALIEQYNTPYPAEILQRGDASEMTKAYKEAVSQYANQNYQMALKSFQNIKPTTANASLYMINCLIEMKAFDKAEDLLKSNRMLLTQDLNIKQNVDWYEAMIMLGNDKVENAKTKLTEINKAQEHIFKEKADQLLKALN